MSQVINKPKILIVDDLPANLLSMKSLLKNINVDIITAESGNTALSIAVQHNLALILLDINMPEMDGFEVASCLMEIEETKNIPIIFVTAIHHDETSILRGYDSGAVDYVEKPITPEILLSKVNIFLNLWTLKAGLEYEINLRKTAEAEIEYLALHDPLTKLPNRRQLQSQLQTTLNRTQRGGQRFALLFLDLDSFKKINDELGHEAGDELLIEVAKRFKANIRSFDILGRYGGDEFIIIFQDISESILLSSKLTQLIQVILKPFPWEGHELQIGVSIGVSIYPDHGDTADILINHADKAMYQAKAAGKNNFKFFSDKLNQQIDRRLLIENHLRHALKNQELEVYFQPVVDVSSGQPIGAEALLRWSQCKALGFVSPNEFIPIAEANGQISTIGIWVLQQVMPVLRDWQTIHIAINASSLQFKNSLLFDELKKLIQQSELDTSRLEVEITESLLLDNSDIVKQQMLNLCGLDVQLSIDDFGTGYSSLSYLKNCPVSTVKIDRSFINEIPENTENCALVKAIIAMAQALSLKVIAEGVETQEQWDFIREQGCDLAQGYFFAKPMPLKQFEEYLTEKLKQ